MKNKFNYLQLDQLTLDNVGFWPLPVKMFLAILLFVLVLLAGYWFDIKFQLQQVREQKQNLQMLQSDLQTQHGDNLKLKEYEKQTQTLEVMFNKALQKLPNRSDTPKLLEKINALGKDNHLTFKLFKPDTVIEKKFLTEIPIQITVVGNYHHLAQFVSDLAKMDHIVTLHDFDIMPYNDKQFSTSDSQKLEGKLLLNITAKTYRLSESDL